MTKPKVTLGRAYTNNATGNRFRVVRIRTPRGEGEFHVCTRRGWKGEDLYTTAEIKREALKQAGAPETLFPEWGF